MVFFNYFFFELIFAINFVFFVLFFTSAVEYVNLSKSLNKNQQPLLKKIMDEMESETEKLKEEMVNNEADTLAF